MKKKINSLALLSLLIVMIYSCEMKEIPEDNNTLKLNATLTDHSECKIFKSTFDGEETPDTLSCIQYEYDSVKNKLIVKHINAAFNCCPDSLYCKVSLLNDTIIIEEYEKIAGCNCNCLFDLSIEITGIAAKKYYLKIVEPYAGDQEKLNFRIDLMNNIHDSHCVTRKLYPWGMKDYGTNTQTEITGHLIGLSGCVETETVNEYNSIPDSVSCINYVFDDASNELILKHISAAFNCCPDTIYCDISFSKDTIVIHEIEENGICDCDCLYDLDIKLEGIESKKYFIKVIESFIGDEEKLYFNIDLTTHHEGSYCVSRYIYPWYH